MASTPYQAYTGDLTAPVNAQQQTGIAGINANANYASPYIQQAAGLAGASTAPISASTIQGYQNPYTQQVVDATNAQMSHDNATAQASLTGNQIAQGALGGNATGVARGVLAGQQGRTMASTDAALYQQSYQQALQAAQQQQQAGLAGANALANYGISGQNAALSGATAQVGAGSLEQQTSQADLDRMYQQYAQAQAYPYQQTQWLSGIATGVGSNLGGTSTGQTTGPAPNQTAQWLGAGLSAAALLSDRDAKEGIERIGKMNDGTPLYRFRYKGSPQWHVGPMAQDVEKRNPDAVSRGVDGYRYVDMHKASEDSVQRATGGGVVAPWADAGKGWIPTVGISSGSGAPHASAPSAPSQGTAFDPSKLASGFSGAAKGLGGLDWRGMMSGNLGADSWGGGSFLGGDAYGGSSASPLAGLDASDYGAGFADGGAVTDEDPAGVAGGQQYAQQAGSPWQLSQNSNGSVSVINVRTGQVVHTGTHSTASTVQASMSARPRAAGGGVAGYAGGGVPDFDDRFGASFPARGVQEWLNPKIETPPASEYNFLDQQGNPDPFGDTNRIVAHDALRRGDGVVSYGADTPVMGTDGKMMGNTTSAQGVAPVVAADEEDDAAPTGVAGRTGGAGSAPVMAFAPQGARNSYGDLPDAIRRPAAEERGGLGLLPISPNASHGLLTAGLGMLASRSPFLGNAVGEGALTGVSAYGKAEENDRKIAAEAEKLSREQRQQSTENLMAERKQTETERHNKVGEEAGSKLPPLYTRDAKGNIMLAPGAEDATRKLTEARHPQQGEPLNDQAVQMLADRVRAGDVKALVGLGRGIQGSADLRRIQTRVAEDASAGKPVNEAARSILENAAQQSGLVTAERTQAAIMAKLSVYGRTAFNATDIALAASKEVPRTQFMPVNKIINAGREKTGDPKVVALGQALMTLSNEYARAIGGGHGTVHDKEAAERRLSAAQTQEQLEAVINIMRREVIAEERAMPAARQQIRDIYNPGAGGSRGSSIAGEHGEKPPAGPVTGASGVPSGAVPPAAQREVGKVYPTPKGDLKWTGEGWVKP